MTLYINYSIEEVLRTYNLVKLKYIKQHINNNSTLVNLKMNTSKRNSESKLTQNGYKMKILRNKCNQRKLKIFTIKIIEH